MRLGFDEISFVGEVGVSVGAAEINAADSCSCGSGFGPELDRESPSK